MIKKYIADPRDFGSIMKLYETITGRKPGKVELAAARARFDKAGKTTRAPGQKK